MNQMSMVMKAAHRGALPAMTDGARLLRSVRIFPGSFGGGNRIFPFRGSGYPTCMTGFGYTLLRQRAPRPLSGMRFSPNAGGL